MNEKDPLQNNPPENTTPETPTITTNPYDNAVVVDEKDRTVLLTEDETIVIEKDPVIDVVPKNRPRKVYAGMWGAPEVAAVAIACFALLVLVLAYIFVVARSNSEVEALRADSKKAENDLNSAKAKYGDIGNITEHKEKLRTSVEDFEVRFLPISSVGQTALYQRINGLIASNGLTNTTGPNYLPLDVADPTRPETDEEKGKGKLRSLFPGLYITMTVEGSYQGLRRFIREVETTEQFVVVSSVELEPADTQKKDKQPGAQQPGGATVGINVPPGMMGDPRFPPAAVQQAPLTEAHRGRTHGETVALRIEMAAYFRRPNFAPQAAPEAAR